MAEPVEKLILLDNAQKNAAVLTWAMMVSLRQHLGVLGALLVTAARVHGDIVFQDDFNSRPSPLWGNESGSWWASGGVYRPTAPANIPAALSFLPFDLTDFSLDVDVADVMDGGIWLRSSPAPGTSLGIKGVLLNLKIPDGGPKIYWHLVKDGAFYGMPLNVNYNAFPHGAVVHLHIEVKGNNYSAFLNGSSTPATTLTTAAFSNGRIALYDFSDQSFDNFVLNGLPPEPASTKPLLVDGSNGSANANAARTPGTAPVVTKTAGATESLVPEPQQPALTLQEGVVLSWPSDFSGYVLEETDSLVSTNWVRVTNNVISGNHVVVPKPKGDRFYRLVAP